MATVVRWQPWTELAGLQTDMSRLMNGLLESNGKTNQSWVPALDVWETDDGGRVRIRPAGARGGRDHDRGRTTAR